MIDKVILDIDGTTWNLIKCITDIYNEDFKFYSKFKPIDWADVKTWDFQELELATPEYINYYFNQPRFFEKVQLMESEELQQRFISLWLAVEERFHHKPGLKLPLPLALNVNFTK